jgi:hypothetical protein
LSTSESWLDLPPPASKITISNPRSFSEIDPIAWPRADAHFVLVDPYPLSTDGTGLSLSVAVDGVHRQNVKPQRPKSQTIVVQHTEPGLKKRHGLCPDKGYNYGEVRALAGGIHYRHMRTWGEHAQVFKCEVGFKAQRRIVKQSHR